MRLLLSCYVVLMLLMGCQNQTGPGDAVETEKPTQMWAGSPRDSQNNEDISNHGALKTLPDRAAPQRGSDNTDEEEHTGRAENTETNPQVEIDEASTRIDEVTQEEPETLQEEELETSSNEEVPLLYGDACHEQGPYPTIDWQMSSPEAEGVDPSGLNEAAMFAGQNQSSCLVVVRNGKLIGEWYWGMNSSATLQKSWSVTKSYSATVAGIAISRGDIGSVHDLVADYVPEWNVEPKDWVTIEHLLSMTSGLKFGLVADNIGISLAKNMSKKAIEWPMKHVPGALWEYNNHTVQMIEPVIRNATNMPPQEYAEQHLFGPLGMTAEWTEDNVGNPTMYMNVKASCRDHAKFGYLYLRKGCWDGVQLLDEQYVHAATSPSSDLNPGYGYWWWLNGQFPTLDSIDFKPKPDILHPDLPHDAFCAVGLGSQVVEVIPSEDLVIVRMGPAPHENLTLWETQGAVLDALMEDGKQLVHNGVVERVFNAIVD